MNSTTQPRIVDLVRAFYAQFKVRGVKNYIGRKGCRTDFFAENAECAFVVRWLRSKPIKKNAQECATFFNRWMEKGTIWSKAKKEPNAWHIMTEDGMLFRRLVKQKQP